MIRFAGRTRLAAMLTILLSATTVAFAQTSDESDREFDRLAERYWQTLQRRPRKGTAFDLWYQHYARADKLPELRAKLDEAIATEPDVPRWHLLRAFLYEIEQQFAEALLAYEQAEQRNPSDYYPVFCRGVLLAQQQRHRDAIAVLDRAIALQPPRGDREQIVQTLVRCYLRIGDRDGARITWRKHSAGADFDTLTIRQLAEVAAGEGDTTAAIELWQQVIERSHDPAATVAAEIEIAQLHADDGQAEIALERFEAALARLRPGSWLARDVCRRIERIHLRKSDTVGLVDFWQRRSDADPQDLQTVEHLARALRLSGRNEDSLDVYRKALAAAPNETDLRRAFIEALVEDRQFGEAVTQCERLLEQTRVDVDLLRLLGQLHLKAATTGEWAAAQEQAIRTWRRIAEARPHDPAAALQAAEACRQAARIPMTLLQTEEELWISETNARLLAAAESFYREALDRAGEQGIERAIPYREYVGEFLHATQRPEDAVAVWKEIAAPPNDSTERLLVLGTIFQRYGYLAEAEETLRQAVQRDARNYRGVEQLIEVLVQRQNFDAAFETLNVLDAAAESRAQKDQARQVRLRICADGKFAEREIERLQAAVRQEPALVEDLWLLGLLQSQQNQYVAAAETLARAVDQDRGNPRLIRDYAQTLERGGNLDEAVAQYERLALLEPRRRTSHYRTIVQLHLRRREYDLARETVDELRNLAPNDVATYLLYVDVTRWLGDRPAQVALLQQARRLAPYDTIVRRQLAHALLDLGDYDAAFDEFWNCWEIAPTLSERIALVADLSQVLQKAGSQQPLIDRLQQVRTQHPRDVPLCLAEAYRRAGDLGQGRRVLSALLAEQGRDAEVLRQLAALAAAEEDWPAALDYQQQVVELHPAWANVLDWARYYSQSQRDEWLTEARERQRRLMKSWAETYREYRAAMQKDDADASRLAALRAELVNLNWARNRYHEKERMLDPESHQQRGYGDVWLQLRLEFEILELVSRRPVTAEDIERRLADSLRMARATPAEALENLCEKGLLKKESRDGVVQFTTAVPADKLLIVAIRDFGRRMLGAQIELDEAELLKLERIVDSAQAGSKAAE